MFVLIENNVQDQENFFGTKTRTGYWMVVNNALCHLSHLKHYYPRQCNDKVNIVRPCPGVECWSAMCILIFSSELN